MAVSNSSRNKHKYMKAYLTITTMAAAKATVHAIAALKAGAWTVTAMQDYFPALKPTRTLRAIPV